MKKKKKKKARYFLQNYFVAEKITSENARYNHKKGEEQTDERKEWLKNRKKM